MRFLLLIFAASVFFVACNSAEKRIDSSEKSAAPRPEQNAYANSKFDIKTYQTDKGWGYDVYIDSALYIHQPTIPAVAGNVAFKSEEAAKKTAGFIIYKIRNNIIPPSLTVKELDSLDVLN